MPPWWRRGTVSRALAVVAFLVSAVLVGLTLHWVLGTALAAASLFGALISATDPVAGVAVFRKSAWSS